MTSVSDLKNLKVDISTDLDRSSSRHVEPQPGRERTIRARYPLFARTRYKNLNRDERAAEGAHAGRYELQQQVRSELSELNSRRAVLLREWDRLNATDAKAQLGDIDAQIGEVESELADLRAPANCGAFDAEKVRTWLLRAQGKRRDGTLFEEFSPSLPAASVEKDERELAKVRAKIKALDEEIAKVDRAPLPVEMALEKAFAEIDKLAGLTPDFSQTLRMTHVGFESERKAQGSVFWPVTAARNGDGILTESPNALAIAVWAMGDRMKELAEKEIREIASRSADPIPLADREAARLAIVAGQFDLFRIDEALVSRLHEAGRTDVHFHPKTPIPALLRLC